MLLKPPDRSLRIRVTLWVALPLVLILGVITVVEYTRYRATVLKNASMLASHSGQVVESSLRHAMLASDFTEVQSVLNTLGEIGEFQVVYLMDTSGEVIFAPYGEGAGLRLDSEGVECQPCHRLPVSERPDSVVITTSNGDQFFRSMHPIENSPECMQCHDPQDRLLGLLLTDLSIAPLESALRADLYEHLGWWGLTLLFTILVVNLVLSRFVLSRLEHLAVDIRRFGQNQGSPLSSDDHPDEIGQLSAAFHTMASHVQARSDENLRLSDSLREQNSLRGELLQRLITAQEAERRRIARELHDDLGQRLGGLGFHVQALDGMIAADPIRAREQLGPIRALIGETTSHMYDLIRDLRPSALDDLGLEAALSSLAQRVLGSRGIEYRLQTNAAGQRMPPAIETTLYRVFQEAMTNIVRHSGASEVVITLARHDHILEATIRDNGCGFEPAAVKANDQNERGLGLLGMNERVTQCGGAITIASGPGAGTEIFVRVPLDKGADYE